MEMINNNPRETGTEEQTIRPRNIYLGVTLAAAGVIWLLKNFGVVSYEVFDVIFSWSMLVLVIGGYLLVLQKWVAGAILAALGLCLVISNIAGIDMPFNKIILPLLCIIAGVAVIVGKR